MNSTLSVSKGCFIFKNKRSEKGGDRNKNEGRDRWYSTYKQTWKWMEENMTALHERSFTTVMDSLVSFIASAFDDSELNPISALPTAALLTGINMPDHASLFCTLCASVREKVSPYVAVLYAHKCNTLNTAMDQMFFQFISRAQGNCWKESTSEEEAEEGVGKERKCVIRSAESKVNGHRLKMRSLQSWFKLQQQDDGAENYSSPKKKMRQRLGSQSQPLVVVIPDLEKFSAPVLHDLILILSGAYRLRFVLVLGVATSIAAVHRALPHRVMARLRLKVLHAPPSVDLLTLLLDEVLFSPECPFRLGSRIFNFLIDVFLYCNLSVKGFVQALKFCLAEHMSGQPWKVLCCASHHLEESAEALTEEDVSTLRQLPSFHRFLDSLEPPERRRLLTDNVQMKITTVCLLRELQVSLSAFQCALQCLCILAAGLPQQPLGTQVRELYGQAVGSPLWLTPAYKTCFHLLGFLSRRELEVKLQAVLALLSNSLSGPLTALASKLHELIEKLEKAATHHYPQPSALASPEKLLTTDKLTRHILKEDLLAGHRAPVPASPWEDARTCVLNFLAWQALPQMLSPPTKRPLAEVLFFEGVVAGARLHIAATPRTALHTAFHCPYVYLQCSCCRSDCSSSVPDIIVAHRLYKECGRFINIYDWLQAFAALISPDSQHEAQVDDSIQARFTWALTELQYLGFIKTSSRKVDHVVKLSFDGEL